MKGELVYQVGVVPPAEQIIELYRASGLPRPLDDTARIQKMFDHSNLVITAWDGHRLVGVCRCITDWVWSCYLADLAICPEYQKLGIGKTLINIVKEKVGELSMILLLSVPSAFEYYPAVGFSKEDRAFMIPRAS